jgi:hypothetical protein
MVQRLQAGRQSRWNALGISSMSNAMVEDEPELAEHKLIFHWHITERPTPEISESSHGKLWTIQARLRK